MWGQPRGTRSDLRLTKYITTLLTAPPCASSLRERCSRNFVFPDLVCTVCISARALAPTRASIEYGHHCDERLYRASAGVRTRRCSLSQVSKQGVHDIPRKTFTDSEAQARPASGTACARALAPARANAERTATTVMSFSCAPALVSERCIARSEQGVHDITWPFHNSVLLFLPPAGG